MLDIFQANPRFRDTRMVLELGRYLVAESGYYLTRVTSTKDSRGKRFAICDGGMNHHLPASGNFGMVIRRNYCLHKVGGDGEPERIDLVGPLCTSIDRLASNAELPRVEAGDLRCFHAALDRHANRCQERRTDSVWHGREMQRLRARPGQSPVQSNLARMGV